MLFQISPFSRSGRLFPVPKTQLNTQLHAFEDEDVIEFSPLSNRLDPFKSFEFANYFSSVNNTGEYILQDFNQFVGDEISIQVYSDEVPNILFENNLTDILIHKQLDDFTQ